MYLHLPRSMLPPDIFVVDIASVKQIQLPTSSKRRHEPKQHDRCIALSDASRLYPHSPMLSSIHFLVWRTGLSVRDNHSVVLAQVLQIKTDFKTNFISMKAQEYSLIKQNYIIMYLHMGD